MDHFHTRPDPPCTFPSWSSLVWPDPSFLVGSGHARLQLEGDRARDHLKHFSTNRPQRGIYSHLIFLMLTFPHICTQTLARSLQYSTNSASTFSLPPIRAHLRSPAHLNLIHFESGCGCVYFKRTVDYSPVLHRRVCALFFLSAKLLGTLGCNAGRVIPSCTRWYALSKLEGRKNGEGWEECLLVQPKHVCTFSCCLVWQSSVVFCVTR